jgi:hypothetical protein
MRETMKHYEIEIDVIISKTVTVQVTSYTLSEAIEHARKRAPVLAIADAETEVLSVKKSTPWAGRETIVIRGE